MQLLTVALIHERHDAAIRNPQSFDPADTQSLVQHSKRIVIHAHFARARGVVACSPSQQSTCPISTTICGECLQVVECSLAKSFHSSRVVYSWCFAPGGQEPLTISLVPVP